MKILLLADYPPDQAQSMHRYARLLELTLRDLGHQVKVLRPTVVVGRESNAHPEIAKWLGYADKFLLFPPAVKSAIKWADIVHLTDHAHAYNTRYLKNKPHLVTCHDMLSVRSAFGETPDHPTRWTGRVLQRWIWKGIQRSQHIVCVSEETATDVTRLCPEAKAKVSVIPNALNYPYSPMPPQESVTRLEKLGVPTTKPFVFHLGSSNLWHKNRMGVLKIFLHLRSQTHLDTLVMAGRPLSAEMRRFIELNSLRPNVIEKPDVSDEDLRALYSNAAFLLFPSLTEGFGWPVIEAQACGCPVVTSNRPPMNRVAGGAALLIDPEDHKAAASTISQSIPLLAGYRSAGLRNASRFLPATMAVQYESLYRNLLEGKSIPTFEPTAVASIG